MKKITGILFLFALSFSSCRKDSGPYINPPDNPIPVSFTNEIQPIFNSYCISCHNETHPYLNLKSCCSWFELMATGYNAPYLDTINPEQSTLYKRITGVVAPVMPPSGNTLAETDINIIKKWMEEGAKNN